LLVGSIPIPLKGV